VKLSTPAATVLVLFVVMLLSAGMGITLGVALWFFLSPFACYWWGTHSSGYQIQIVKVQPVESREARLADKA
jgi:hypothetical protein